MPVTATATTAERGVWRSALVLFSIMAAHAVLETARDALFLSRLPPTDLAWAYVAIAALALGSLQVMRRFTAQWSPRRMLVGLLAGASIITAVMAGILRHSDVVFAFYVWTGLLATLAVPLFWLLAGQSFTVAEAKRFFSFISAGAVLGAVLGSAMAAALVQVIPARRLVAVGAGLIALSAVITWLYAPRITSPPPTATPREVGRPFPEVRSYLRLLGLLGLASTVALTLGDLAFKTVAADTFAPEELATFFGIFYAALNLVGLVVQIAVAPRILRSLGVAGAMLTLPTFVAVGGIGFALSGGFLALLLFKVADGGLRHSLHRVTSELLYLPLSSALRERFKGTIDALSQRGGQALAALGAFAIAEPRWLAVVAAAVTVFWLVAALLVRRAYLDRFRDTLYAGHLHRSATLPQLDLRSLEVVMEALGSLDDTRAIAALELLVEQDHKRLVPALVLFHPRVAVVQRALELLDATDRPDIRAALGQLASHPDPQIRAATLLSLARADLAREGAREERFSPEAHACLVTALADPDLEVRATAAVALGRPLASAELDALSLDDAARVALAKAIGRIRDQAYEPYLKLMLQSADSEVVREVALALEQMPLASCVPALLSRLAERDARPEVRRALVAIGEPSFRALIAALEDPMTPLTVRRHIPRTILRFEPTRATAALVAHLEGEKDGVSAYKILRALGRLRHDDPKLRIDARPLVRYARASARQAERCARWQRAMSSQFGARPTPGAHVIGRLLDERRRHALERVFRVYGILSPREDFETLSDALLGTDVARRDASFELLEHHLPTELLAQVRSALAITAKSDEPNGYEHVVAEMLEDPSDSLRCMAAYHAAELGLVGLRPAIERLRTLDGIDDWVVRECDRALATLAQVAKQEGIRE